MKCHFSSFRGACRAASLLLIYLAVLSSRKASAGGVVFRISEPVSPGDAVMAYGGDLQGLHSVQISRLADLPAGTMPGLVSRAMTNTAIVPVLQGSEKSLKFIIPQSFAPGVFAFDYGEKSRLIDAPTADWCQTTKLLPGLGQNEAAPGASIQIVGRNFVPGGGKPGNVRIVLRSGGRVVELTVTSVDKYSLIAALPSSVSPGSYQVWVHNGYGGPGSWGGGITLTVKTAVVWPKTVFNIRNFGAVGDDIQDDSGALRKAIEAAKRSGGGIIYCPAGTYRLSGWFEIPHRVVLRGESRDLVWLKWPLTDPLSVTELIPSVLYASGEFGIENLSVMVRNAQTILRDLSWDAAATGRAALPQLQSDVLPLGAEHDIFIRNVDFQFLYYSGRPSKLEATPQWRLNGFGWKNNELIKILAIDGVQNLEVSNCRFVGGTQRILDSVNARLVANEFNNQWATLAWTDLGGEYIVLQNNEIVGASSWRGNRLPVRHLYCAFNHSTNLVSGEREALTFDVNEVFPRESKLPPKSGAAHAVAWEGHELSASSTSVRLQEASLPVHVYRGLDLLVLDGRGAGQLRTITDNGADRFTVAPAWDVIPDATSVLLAYQLFGDCILYRNRAEDTSVLLQIWGFLYDVTFDGNEVERSQGMWGLSGWFVQWLNNRLYVAVTFHQGVGPGAPSREETTPEGGASYGLMGFDIAGKISQLHVPFPYVRGCVIRANSLYHGHRLELQSSISRSIRTPSPVVMQDVIINRNYVESSPIGIAIDANASAVVLANNTFEHVTQHMRLAFPACCLILH